MLHQAVIFIRRYVNKLITIPLPRLIRGQGKLAESAQLLLDQQCSQPLIVTDKVLTELGFTAQITQLLTSRGLAPVVFDRVTPDPVIAIVNQGVELYKAQGCDSVIALGGGSVIDCAKAIAASVSKNKAISTLAGLFKVRTRLPLLIAIPTTAGTGSEATLVAVITDPERREKFTVIDPCLVPNVAILDPLLMTGLPPDITAHTGMDALTHAIESYVGVHGTKQTNTYCLDAIKRIFQYLPQVFVHGEDVDAREEMAMASYYAGLAFTRTSVGYVHAIAHQLGAIYHIPHGLANAVLLPHILDFSFDKAYRSYAEIAYHLELVRVDENERAAAHAFVTKVKALGEQLNIPKCFNELDAKDIETIAMRAIKEAFCNYPVPRVMSVAQCQQILVRLLPKS